MKTEMFHLHIARSSDVVYHFTRRWTGRGSLCDHRYRSALAERLGAVSVRFSECIFRDQTGGTQARLEFRVGWTSERWAMVSVIEHELVIVDGYSHYYEKSGW